MSIDHKHNHQLHDHSHEHNHNHGHSHVHDHAHSHLGHSNKNIGKFRLLAVIIFNCLITAAEFIGGMLSGSLALVSDAWHNLSDVLSLILGYAGEHISEKRGNRNYTFGLKRFEVMVALFNSLALVAIGVYIIIEAIQRFLNPQTIDISIMLPIAFIGLLGNFFSIGILLKNRNDNLNLRAAFLHLFFDTLSSVGVIVAAIIMYFFNLGWMDVAISLMIAIMMFWSSWDIIAQSTRVLLQGVPYNLDIENILNTIKEINGIDEVHGLHVWSINSNEVFLSCHICTRLNNDTLLETINDKLMKEYEIKNTVIQIENEKICV
jgi:cobalt-zinc-cadmium efflux system protein